jgi:hypothetical protein
MSRTGANYLFLPLPLAGFLTRRGFGWSSLVLEDLGLRGLPSVAPLTVNFFLFLLGPIKFIAFVPWCS